MTNKQFQKIITKCNSLAIQHRKLLRVAEEEYIKRFGSNPSEVDDDWWIDTMHYGTGSPYLNKIIENAEWTAKR